MSDEAPKTEQNPTPEPAPAPTPPGAKSPAPRKTVTLPSGRTASILVKYKGRHVIQASRMAGGVSDQMKFVFAIIAVKTLLDGQPITVEDIEEMDGDDVMKLMGEAMGKDGTSSSGT